MNYRTPITLSPDSARRIGKAVKAMERAPRRLPTGLRSSPRITLPGWFAVVTVAIGSGNPASMALGSGKGKLQTIIATTSGGTTSYSFAARTNTPDVIVLNGGSSIAVGRLIQVKFVSGFYVADVDYC